MFTCLNAVNQENLFSGSREKCITDGCIRTGIYIKIQKLLSEIKIAAFVHCGGSATKQLR